MNAKNAAEGKPSNIPDLNITMANYEAAKTAALNKRAELPSSNKVVPGPEPTSDELVLADFDAKEM